MNPPSILGIRVVIWLNNDISQYRTLLLVDHRVLKCDVTKIIFLEDFNFGSGF